MKTIRLAELDRPAPACASFDEEEAVRRYERAMREHRAYAEKWEITPLDGRVDGAFRVQGSGDSHLVDIVDGSLEADACSCPDFLSNDLGTCKHLEAVRRALASSKILKKAHELLGPEPLRPTITVEARGGLRLVPRGKWSRPLLAKAGLVERLDGTLAPAAPGWPSAVPPSIRVVHAAPSAWERLRAGHALAERSERVGRAIAKGRLGLDVLSSPLFAFQREGVAHLVKAGRALLADDMGLGKTVQAIAACEVLAARGEADRVLVVTAASLKDQWARDIERFTGSRAVVVDGGDKARRDALASNARYKILTYELTFRELERLQALDADVLVLDEAQRAKNFRTKTATTLRAIPSRFLFVLTGTPIEGRLDDLYALVQLVDPRLFGPLWRFNLEFHVQNSKGRVTGVKNLARLRERLAPVVLRRRKEDVLSQLPAVTHQSRHVALTDDQARLEAGYRQKVAQLLAIAERRALTEPEQEKTMRALLKARQACDAAELCDPKSAPPGSPKLDELETIVEEVVGQGSQKIVVFSEWAEMLKLAAARLDKLGVGYRLLHGGVPADRRPALVAAFRDDPRSRVLLCSDAGGAGQSLIGASYLVHLDLPFTRARLDQRTARVHRVGQTRGLTAIYLCAETGIERAIKGTLSGKRTAQAAQAAPGAQPGDDDRLEVPSFTTFLGQVRDVLGRMKAEQLPRPQGSPDTPAQPPVTAAVPPLSLSPSDPDAPPAAELAPEGAGLVPSDNGQSILAGASTPKTPLAVMMPELSPEPPEASDGAGPMTQRAPFASETAEPRLPAARRADERLRLARVVLEAGFPADAARAAYEALASALASKLTGASPRDHAQLVGAVFRELIPSGKVPAAAHGALARLHDLAALEAHGVDVEPATAKEAVAEAESWVARLGAREA